MAASQRLQPSARSRIQWSGPFSSRGVRSRDTRQPLPCASAATANLATYQLRRRTQAPTPSSSPSWFQPAVREIVRHLDDAPFLELVHFDRPPLVQPQFSSYSVPADVVAAPELWRAVAETVSSESPDVTILVQRVRIDNGASSAALAQKQEPCSCATADLHRLSSAELKEHVEVACRQLVASGVGHNMMKGQVGECCEGDAANGSHGHHKQQGQSPAVAAIVPFKAAAVTPLRAVLARAIAMAASAGCHSSVSGYWGVVVQSRHHTGAEGCYLLKAIRNVPNAGDGCSCTHFSLTRVCEGENLERQFVQSWLA